MKILIGTTEISEKDIVSIDGNYADKINILIKNIHKYEKEIFGNSDVHINDNRFFYINFSINNEYSECKLNLSRSVVIDFSFLDTEPNGIEIRTRIEDILREYCLIK